MLASTGRHHECRTAFVEMFPSHLHRFVCRVPHCLHPKMDLITIRATLIFFSYYPSKIFSGQVFRKFHNPECHTALVQMFTSHLHLYHPSCSPSKFHHPRYHTVPAWKTGGYHTYVDNWISNHAQSISTSKQGGYYTYVDYLYVLPIV